MYCYYNTLDRRTGRMVSPIVFNLRLEKREFKTWKIITYWANDVLAEGLQHVYRILQYWLFCF